MQRWFLTAALASVASATCYYPDGSNAAIDYNYQPCGDSSTTYSTCCYFGEGDKCLPNGLCKQPDRFDYRAACQNKDWSNCPEVCLDSEYSLRGLIDTRCGIVSAYMLEAESGTWLPLQECGTNEYCCPSSSGNDCCDNGSETYSLAAPNPSSKSDKDSEAGKATDSNPAETASDAASSGFQSIVRTTATEASDPSNDSSSSGSAKSSVPVGAVAGGVVGSVAVIGLLALGGLCFFGRQRNKPTVPSDGTVVVGGAGGSNGSNVSDHGKEKPVLHQNVVAEIEGSAGNVYTEADSQLISRARFAARQDNEENTWTAAQEEKPLAHQKQKQNMAEVEGSAGNFYTEADSEAISQARFQQRQHEEEGRDALDDRTKFPPRPNPAEVEGSAGNIYIEANSQAAGQDLSKDKKARETIAGRQQDKSAVHELAS
ncbi:hypothetical protein FZEAL_2984 [Fusarium zealandicum]|uniref:Uncharacterized protein n=1 Tax=Fusarium zealandicum TaxID=1053134 RepID=A0A8H4UQE6_9HYPO|nr:hypothetical protein FZEAL_2984 [Fusarium zealandicum]